eukprot:422017-Hanusia_phi.AAC.1
MGQKPRSTAQTSAPQKPGKSLPSVGSLAKCYVMVSGRRGSHTDGTAIDEMDPLDMDDIGSFLMRKDVLSNDHRTEVKDEGGPDLDIQDLEIRFSILREIFEIYEKLITNRFKLDGSQVTLPLSPSAAEHPMSQLRRMARNCEGSKGALS